MHRCPAAPANAPTIPLSASFWLASGRRTYDKPVINMILHRKGVCGEGWSEPLRRCVRSNPGTHTVIFGRHVALHTFALLRTPPVDVLPGIVASDK